MDPNPKHEESEKQKSQRDTLLLLQECRDILEQAEQLARHLEELVSRLPNGHAGREMTKDPPETPPQR